MDETLIYVLGVLIIALGFFTVLLRRGREVSAEAASSFPLEETIAAIKQELLVVENTPGDRLGLSLKEVKIVLSVQQDQEISGSAKLSVPVFSKSVLESGAKVVETSSSKVSVVLVPPKPERTLRDRPRPPIRFAELFIATREALARAMETEPPLDAKSVDIDLSFVLVQETSAGATVEAMVLTLGAKAGVKDTGANLITLKYANPALGPQEKNPSS